MSRARPEKEAGADLRSTPGRGMTFRDLCEATCSESGVNSVPPVYPVGELHERLLDEFADVGMTPPLARRIAKNESAARLLLGDEAPVSASLPGPSLHEMLEHVLDGIAAVADEGGGIPGASQAAQALLAFGAVWRRPWVQGLSPSQLARRCGVSREVMSRRVRRVRKIYGLPQAKSLEAREKLSAARRRVIEHPHVLVVTRIEKEKEAA